MTARRPKARRGRSPLPPEEQRADPISVRPTPAQDKAIRAGAKAAGLSLSAWVLEAIELALARGSTR